MWAAAISFFLLALAAAGTESKVNSSAPASSPLVIVGSVKASPVLTWAQIHDNNGAVLIFNPSSEGVNVKTELHVVPETTEGNSPLPISLSETEATIPPNEVHRFVIKIEPEKIPAPGNYLVTLVLKDGSGKTQPTQQQFKITVAGLPPLLPKTTGYVWRLAPIGSSSPWDSLIVRIPLTHPYETSDSCSNLTAALRSDSGDSITAVYKCSSGQRQLVLDRPRAAGKYQGDITLGQYPEKTTVDLTIFAKDIVLYPILTIAFGTYLAFVVKRYLAVVRIAWGLREEEAHLALAFRASRQRFEKIAEGQPFSSLSIEADVNRQLAEIRQYAKQLEQRKMTTLSPTDPDYVKAMGTIQSLQDAIAAWPELAKMLLSLAETVEAVHTLTSESDFQPEQAVPPQVVQTALKLMSQGAVPTAKITSVTDQASSLQGVLADWSDAFRKALALRDAFRQIPPDGDDSDDKKALRKTLQQEFEVLPLQFWEVRSSDDLMQLTSFGGTLNTIAAQLAQLQAEPSQLKTLEPYTETLRLAPSSSKVLSQYAWNAQGKTYALRLEADPGRRVEQLRTAIWRSDVATTVFAGLIGLLTGLNTFYVGKPFGSVQDYLSLFLWAAGTKAALDLLLGVVDKFAPSISK
jgi:hypothetical protein